MKKFIRDNSLSLTFALLFAVSMAGLTFFGYMEHLKELSEGGAGGVSVLQYLSSGHFLQATFENWESEFLQMALLVVLTIFLQQKGSSESKDFDTDEEVDREPDPLRKDAPWPVRHVGLMLAVYKHSLTIALMLLFAASFAGHFYGSLKNENLLLRLQAKRPISARGYLADSRFWFESFQNWHSEFLSIFAIIILSIFLRQKGSSQSKLADPPNGETGE